VTLEELEARLKVLEDKNRRLEDVEEIKKLQRIYGYYVERGQLDE
jgi:N-acetyl-anhydromuramyl-L-alanine amidase AmpD